MKKYLYKSKMLVLIFSISAFMITLMSATIVKYRDKEFSEFEGMSKDYIVCEIEHGNSDEHGSLCLSNIIGLIDERDSNYTMVKIFLEGRAITYDENSQIEFDLVNGRKFNEEDFLSNANVCIISEEFKENCYYEKSDMYCKILGQSYKVIGVYEEGEVDISYFISLCANNLLSQNIVGKYYIDTGKSSVESFEYIKQQLVSKDESLLMSRKDGSSSGNSFDEIIKTMTFILLIGGALIIVNAATATFVWLQARKKEIGVRKLVGASKMRIFLWLSKSYILIITTSYTIGAIISGVIIMNSKSIEAAPVLYKVFGNIVKPEILILSYFTMIIFGYLFFLANLHLYLKRQIIENIRG